MSIVEQIDDTTLPWARRIDKLRAKAETTNSQEEALQLIAKAEELMVTKGVTEMMLAELRGLGKPEEIVKKIVRYTGIYRKVLIDIGFAIIRNNNCRGVWYEYTWGKPHYVQLSFIGFESDVEHAMLLDTSCQLQCARALRSWWRDQPRYYSGMEGYKARRQFIISYAEGLAAQLRAARLRGQAEAAKQVAREADVSMDEVTDRTALVLRSRKGIVNDWMDEHYGDSLRSVSRRYDSGGGTAARAGYDAGRKANINRPGLDKNKAIGGR